MNRLAELIGLRAFDAATTQQRTALLIFPLDMTFMAGVLLALEGLQKISPQPAETLGRASPYPTEPRVSTMTAGSWKEKLSSL